MRMLQSILYWIPHQLTLYYFAREMNSLNNCSFEYFCAAFFKYICLLLFSTRFRLNKNCIQLYLDLFIWETGRDNKWDGTIFIPLLYVDFFNQGGINTHDGVISVPLFWALNNTGDSIIFPADKSCEWNYSSRFNISA